MPRYTPDTDLDSLSLAELKQLAQVALNLQERDRIKSRAYYENNREACIARSARTQELKKLRIAAERAARTPGENASREEWEPPGEE